MKKLGVATIAIFLLTVVTPSFAEEPERVLTHEEQVRQGNEKREIENQKLFAREQEERRAKAKLSVVVVQTAPVATASSQVLIVVPGQVKEIRNLPRLDWPKQYNGEMVRHDRIENYSGWAFNRIRINELLETIVSKAHHLTETKGWDFRYLRYQVIMLMSSSSLGISGSPSTYLSQSTTDSKLGNSVSSSISVSASGSFGWSQSKVSPEFHLIFFEICPPEEK
jgi:hypothetical protein